MPISRFKLKSEYGLGVKELYIDASKREDPKAVLDGVAVAGLVGLLRHLGDLAEFAAEVFHGLQEEMTNTTTRSRKLIIRVRHLEATLPPLEKAMLSQTNHIHFAYTPGSEWHARIRNEQNHFIYRDLPRCIMDSYEECREPPCLLALDKFDTGGPGSCLKRYSDPTFFRRVSGNSDMNYEKSNKKRKARKTKKRRSSKRSSQFTYDTLKIDSSGRVQFSSPRRQRQSSPHTVSTFDMTFKSDLVDRSDSHGSGDRMGFIECVFHTSASVQADETKNKQSYSGSDNQLMNNQESEYPEEQTVVVNGDNPRTLVLEKDAHSSSTVTWDEKVEIVEPMVLNYGMEELPSLHEMSSEIGRQEREPTFWKSGNDEVRAVHETNFQFDEPDLDPMEWNSSIPKVEGTNFEVDDLDIEPMGPMSWSNEMPEVHEKSSEFDKQEMELIGQHSGGNEMSVVYDKCSEFDEQKMEPIGQDSWDNTKSDLHQTDLKHDEQEMEPDIEEDLNLVCTSVEGVDPPKFIFDKNEADEIESETDNFEDALNTIESESETDDHQTKGEIESCSHAKDDSDDVNNERIAHNTDERSLGCDSPSTSYNDLDKEKCNSMNDSACSLLPACEESLQCSPASHDISGRELSENPESLVSSVHSAEDAPLQSIQSSSVQDVSSRDNFSVCDDNADGLQQESAAGESSSSVYEATSTVAGTDELFICSPYVSQQPRVKSSHVGPVALWTNGSLLGLQPSKPPDSTASDGANTNNSDAVGPLYQNLRLKDDHLQGKLVTSANECDYRNTNFEQPTDNHEVDCSKKLPLSFSNAGLETKLNCSVDSELGKSSAHSQSQLLPSAMRPEDNAHGAADVTDPLDEAICVDEERSSFLSGFGHDLLMNGFQTSRLMEYDEKNKADSSQKAHDLENGPHVTLHCSFSGTNLTEEFPSLDSAPPSPPLEHMNISFHPINSFETSKLKLKYPEAIDHHDETSDAFPSFQLVPEPTLHHDIDSDSDDDTFCRTNPCLSDDDLSHLSNSELWESDDSSESRDHIVHNGLCRISSGESISSSFEHEEVTKRSTYNGFGSIGVQDMMGVSHASSSPLTDIPVLQDMNPFGFQETKIIKYLKSPMEPFDLQEPTPEPPPLPPLQWRVSNPQTDALEGKESTLDLNSSFSDSKDPGPLFPYPAKPVVGDLISTGSERMNVTVRNKQLHEQKLNVNVQEKTNQAVNRRNVDEEDFLHQIRTKSFNLRKTGSLKPTPKPVAPATNIKVTAILAKANAIRQAVVSDDGEDDDRWSDT